MLFFYQCKRRFPAPWQQWGIGNGRHSVLPGKGEDPAVPGASHHSDVLRSGPIGGFQSLCGKGPRAQDDYTLAMQVSSRHGRVHPLVLAAKGDCASESLHVLDPALLRGPLLRGEDAAGDAEVLGDDLVGGTGVEVPYDDAVGSSLVLGDGGGLGAEQRVGGDVIVLGVAEQSGQDLKTRRKGAEVRVIYLSCNPFVNA